MFTLNLNGFGRVWVVSRVCDLIVVLVWTQDLNRLVNGIRFCKIQRKFDIRTQNFCVDIKTHVTLISIYRKMSHSTLKPLIFSFDIKILFFTSKTTHENLFSSVFMGYKAYEKKVLCKMFTLNDFHRVWVGRRVFNLIVVLVCTHDLNLLLKGHRICK